jgi:branched-chain amino acid transport system ATP-binding protein
MLTVSKLNFSYDDLKVLWDIDLEVHEGEIVTVVGANGAGKSTTLKNISRLVRPNSGSITFKGIDLTRMEPHHVVEEGVVQVPEGRKIFPEMSVRENLRMGSYIASARKNREENIERVFTLFPRLREREKQLGGTMSGGEQQMLAIGRALMARPKVLLLDEPSMGLAPMVISQIFKIISEINKQGTTVLLVEQNAQQALSRSDRAYILETGSVTRAGNARDLLADDSIRAAYLGVA